MNAPVLFSPGQLEALKREQPCDAVAAKWVALRRAGRRMIGPCPVCSPDAQSTTATRFDCDRDGWVCAVCCDGGDVIRLVQRVQGLEFRDAIAWLGGVRDLDPDQERRREAARAHRREQRSREADHYRERERRALWGIWCHALDAEGSEVEAYWAVRGLKLPPPSPHRVRCMPDMPYFAPGAGDVALHRGPCQLAPIVRPDGHFGGLHLTWIDLAQPKGKLDLRDAAGAPLPAKKVRGSKAGGHIELVPAPEPAALVLGEGIEKVAAVWQALAAAGRLDAAAPTAFWTSCDLGNLGGPALTSVPHPTLKSERGRTQRVPGPEPDLAKPAIVLPASVRDLVLLGDSTSDRFTTECALARAAARYAAPARTVRVAWAPDGRDFDELVEARGGRTWVRGHG